MRTLLLRGMLAGVLAGLLYAVFAYLFGEPAVDGAIAFEDQLAAAAGEVPGEELVSRGVQSTLGLGVAALLYGAAVGGIFALAYAFLAGRVIRFGPRGTAATLALLAFLVVIVVPFLKYPANPPASSIDDTIGQRTSLYVVMVVLSVLLAVGAGALREQLLGRLGGWNATLVAAAAYIVLVGVVMVLLPTIDETPADFPAVVFYQFRLASLGGHVVLWTALGLIFGALVDTHARRAAATA
ncbi:CbtA family protein [Pseudonocardia sp. TRM90224]|uniref:CbtA family protein n=1 Tax=Pseudonocardia sp. TRM90224 TaxID=2812678 RepID=UPI001E5055DA|nr:CbtA family protein [Pseudonocardia sp. TRM90224]